jgi:tRNA nucleotidyltransferase (CCA-adding enzyme)
LFIFLNPIEYQDNIVFNKKGDLLPKNIDRAKISSLFLEYCNDWIIPALKNAQFSNVILSYAEHPYVSATYEEYEIDVVFAFLVSEDFLYENGPITAVDRTYYHSEFIHENLTATQLEDIRILKSFFKAQFSYGDKAPIGRGGFIGFAAELMIYHFGDIWECFKNFDKLPDIPMDFYKRSEKDLRKLNRIAKDFLLVMDPTDKKRNVAASICARSWIFCLHKVQEFLKTHENSILAHPKIELPNKDDPEINVHYVIVEFEQLTDDHYTKIRDKLYSLGETLREVVGYELDHSIRFPNVEYTIYFNPPSKKYSLAFYSSKTELDLQYIRFGPKADGSIHHKTFADKHPDAFLRDDILCVYDKRQYVDFLTCIEKETKSRVFKEVELVKICKPSLYTSNEGLMAINILKECVLPYKEELALKIRQKFGTKVPSERVQIGY